MQTDLRSTAPKARPAVNMNDSKKFESGNGILDTKSSGKTPPTNWILK